MRTSFIVFMQGKYRGDRDAVREVHATELAVVTALQQLRERVQQVELLLEKTINA